MTATLVWDVLFMVVTCSGRRSGPLAEASFRPAGRPASPSRVPLVALPPRRAEN